MAGVVRRDGLREKAARAIANANNGGLTEHEPDEGDYYLLDKVLRILGLDAVPDVPPTLLASLPDDRLAEAEAKVQRVEALADDDDGDYIDRDDLRAALSGQAGDTGPRTDGDTR